MVNFRSAGLLCAEIIVVLVEGRATGVGVDVAVLLGEKWQRPTGTRSVG